MNNIEIDDIECCVVDSIQLDNKIYYCLVNINDKNDIYIRRYDMLKKDLVKVSVDEFDNVIQIFRQRNTI